MKFIAILVILSLISRESECGECASDYEVTLPLTRLGSKFYYIEANTLSSWFGANHFCNLHNLRLANINNEGENADLGRELTKLGVDHKFFWVSGNDLVEKGNWFWSSSGRKIMYLNWAPGEPNRDHGDTENCMDVSSGNGALLWNDDVCTYGRNFICELI